MATEKQEALEITPQAAVKWADYMRETSLEIARAQCKQTIAERELAQIELSFRLKVMNEAVALPADDESPSNEEKRDLRVRTWMDTDPRPADLRKTMDDLEERIGYLNIERAHATDMLKIMLEFAYWAESPSLAIDELVKLTDAGREVLVQQ